MCQEIHAYRFDAVSQFKMPFSQHLDRKQIIHELFEQRVVQTPDWTAIVFKEEQLTYQELNQRANQLAHYLTRLGVGAEMLVGICMDRSVDLIVGLLAILKAGGAYLPLDPAYPRERLAFMLEDAQVSVLLTQQALKTGLPPQEVTQAIQTICVDGDWQTIAQESGENLPCRNVAEDLAYTIYTSGSTGKPKGVMIEHRSLTNFALASSVAYGIESSDRMLQFASISFDAAVEEIFSTLIQGATLVLRTPEMLRSIPVFLTACRELNITILDLPTAFWHQICAELATGQVQLPPSIRLVIIGGEKAVPQWLEAWQTHVDPKVRLVNSYGPTEGTVVSTLCDIAGEQAVPINGRVLPIGQPLANIVTYVLDEALQPLAVGETGELYIGGLGVARGYLNRPELTAERFIPMTVGGAMGDRLYRTGDWVRYRTDGHLECLGRIDHQEKIRGFRVELNEIEAILEQHPAVQEAVVIAREDQPGDKRLVAYIVHHDVAQTLIPQLRAFLNQKLPHYMVPSAFVGLDHLPLTINGKVDRRSLPIPASTRPLLEVAYKAPESAIAMQLAEIWAQVLGLGLDQVGIDDSFFDLGGHSLIMTQMIALVEEKFQIVLPMLSFFQSPTVAGLEQTIARQSESDLVHDAVTEAMTFVDLNAEAVLDQSIIADEDAIAAPIPAQHIFLTGATGFLGAHLLHELLQKTQSTLYCLIRAANTVDSQEKIRKNLERYSLWDESLSSRIVPILGNLAKPFLGLTESAFHELAETLDVIYHNGACVNLLYPYTALRETNVFGTREILRLASRVKIKPVHFISTLDVFEAATNAGATTIQEQDSIEQGDSLSGGYAQSKWVAERLMMKAYSRGIPTYIYRPGMITGHSQTGVSNTTDLLCRLIKSMIQMGTAPIADFIIDMTPVDYVSQAIVHLSQKPTQKTFHVLNPQPISLAQLVSEMRTFGYPLQEISYDQWQRDLLHTGQTLPSNALSPLAAILTEKVMRSQLTRLEIWLAGGQFFDGKNTFAGLQGTSIQCPPADANLVKTYLSSFVQNNFLDSPSLSEGAS